LLKWVLVTLTVVLAKLLLLEVANSNDVLSSIIKDTFVFVRFTHPPSILGNLKLAFNHE